MGFWDKTFDIVGRMGSTVEWNEKVQDLDPRYARLAQDAVAMQEAGRLNPALLAQLADFDLGLLRLLVSTQNPLPTVGTKDAIAIRDCARKAIVFAIEAGLPPTSKPSQGSEPYGARTTPVTWKDWRQSLARVITQMNMHDFFIFEDTSNRLAYLQIVRDHDDTHRSVLYMEASAGLPTSPNARSSDEHAALIALGWSAPDKPTIPNYQALYAPETAGWCDLNDGRRVAKFISASLRQGLDVDDPRDLTVSKDNKG